MEVAEAAATVVAFVAGARRFVPQIDGWAVPALVAVSCLAVAFSKHGSDWVPALKMAGETFVLAFGGFAALRKVAEGVAPKLPDGGK